MLQGICSKIDQKDIRNRLKRAGKERYDAVQITESKKKKKILKLSGMVEEGRKCSKWMQKMIFFRLS